MSTPINTYIIELKQDARCANPDATRGMRLQAPDASSAKQQFIARFPHSRDIRFGYDGNFRCRLKFRGILNYQAPSDDEAAAYERRVMGAHRRIVAKRFGKDAVANYFWVSGPECESEPAHHLTKLNLGAGRSLVLKTYGRAGKRLRHQWMPLD